MNCWLAVVTIAERDWAVVFAAAVTVTDPAPDPVEFASVSQEAVVEAVQVQPSAAVTENPVTPPAACTVAEVGLMLTEQVTPVCRMV